MPNTPAESSTRLKIDATVAEMGETVPRAASTAGGVRGLASVGSAEAAIEPSRCTTARNCRSRNSTERGCTVRVSSAGRSMLTRASGARTTRAPSGLRMSSPVVRSASAPSRSISMALSRRVTCQPGPSRAAMAPVRRGSSHATPIGPLARRR